MDFYNLVKMAVDKGASDIHLASGNHPAYRLHGNVIFTDDPALTEGEVTAVIKALLMADKFNTFMTVGEACLLYTSPSPRDTEGSRMPSSA